MDSTCEECGSPYTPKSKRSRYCTDKCRYKARDRARMVPCSICGEPMHLGGANRNLPADQRAHNQCRSSDIPEHGLSRYHKGCRCGECKAAASEYTRAYNQRPEVKAHRQQHYRQLNQPTYHRSCTECSTPFTTRYKNTRLCSAACGSKISARLNAERMRQRRLPVLYTGPAYAPPIVHVKTAHRIVSGECRTCGDWFLSEHRDVTCSAACADVERRARKRIHKDKRRALKRSAYVADVSRIKVFEADDYRCHLCGKTTDKTKQVPHPNAPTIDHVIPLAVGGTHEPSNCRTACFVCNARKGHRVLDDQVELISR